MASTVRFDDLSSLERLALAARRFEGGILAQGAPRLPCGGTELSGYRDYAAGDDYRHIDWSVCARHDELRVRQFAIQRDCRVHLLLDSSASMGLGKPVARFTLAARIAAALGYVALDRQAELTLFTFSDRLEQRFGPLRGKGRAGTLLSELARQRLAGRGRISVGRPSYSSATTVASAGHVVVISDLGEAEACCAGLDVLRLAGCSPRVVHIDDPCEAGEVTPGDLELVDVESGDLWQVTITGAHLPLPRASGRAARAPAALLQEMAGALCQGGARPAGAARLAGGDPNQEPIRVIAPAMILMRPSALLWGLAAAAIVLVYLRAIRPARVEVATGRLWLRILGEPRTSARLWRRRRVRSAAIHMAILGLIVFAAADPCWNRPRTVVLVIDNSLDTAAPVGQANRLAEAKQAAQSVIRSLSDREYGRDVNRGRGRIGLRPATGPEVRLAAAVDRLTAVERPSRMEDAVRVAAELAAPGTRLEIHAIGQRTPRARNKTCTTRGDLPARLGRRTWRGPGRVSAPWPWAVCMAILLLAVEWAFYHRQWTC